MLKQIQLLKQMDAKYRWPVGILAGGLLTGLLQLAVPGTGLLLIVAVLFLLLGPGMAFVRLLRLSDWTVELMLGISLSLVMDTMTAALALYTGLWNPGGVLWGLILVSWLGAGLQILLIRRPITNILSLTLREKLK